MVVNSLMNRWKLDPKEPEYNQLKLFALAYDYGLDHRDWNVDTAISLVLEYHDGDSEKAIRGLMSIVAKLRRGGARSGKPNGFYGPNTQLGHIGLQAQELADKLKELRNLFGSARVSILGLEPRGLGSSPGQAP